VIGLFIENKRINVLYFFFDKKFESKNLKQRCDTLKYGLNKTKIMIRSIYLDNVNHSCESIRDTYGLKKLDTFSDDIFVGYCYGQYISYYRFLFDCNIKEKLENEQSLVNILTILSDEQSKFSCCDNIHYYHPYPLGTFGSGFLTDLTKMPLWDVSVTTPMIYKGTLPEYLVIDGYLNK